MKINKFQRVGDDNLDELIDAGVARATAARELSAAEIGEVSGAGLSMTSGHAKFVPIEWLGQWPWRTALPRQVAVSRPVVDPQFGGGIADQLHP